MTLRTKNGNKRLNRASSSNDSQDSPRCPITLRCTCTHYCLSNNWAELRFSVLFPLPESAPGYAWARADHRSSSTLEI